MCSASIVLRQVAKLSVSSTCASLGLYFNRRTLSEIKTTEEILSVDGTRVAVEFFV